MDLPTDIEIIDFDGFGIREKIAKMRVGDDWVAVTDLDEDRFFGVKGQDWSEVLERLAKELAKTRTSMGLCTMCGKRAEFPYYVCRECRIRMQDEPNDAL